MTDHQAGTHRSRHRRRATAPQGPPQPPAVEQPVPDHPVPAPPAAEHPVPDHPVPEPPAADPPRPRPRRSRPDHGERAMRDLVGAGPSQLGVSRALRGRDVDRPTEADLAAAERDVVIVRRGWQPPAER